MTTNRSAWFTDMTEQREADRSHQRNRLRTALATDTAAFGGRSTSAPMITLLRYIGITAVVWLLMAATFATTFAASAAVDTLLTAFTNIN